VGGLDGWMDECDGMDRLGHWVGGFRRLLLPPPPLSLVQFPLSLILSFVAPKESAIIHASHVAGWDGWEGHI
jgi:hypothetical protein